MPTRYGDSDRCLTYKQVWRYVVVSERNKDEESPDPQGLPLIKPTIWISCLFHQPEKGIRIHGYLVDESFRAPVVVKPHQNEDNRDDKSLMRIDIGDDLHSAIRPLHSFLQ